MSQKPKRKPEMKKLLYALIISSLCWGSLLAQESTFGDYVTKPSPHAMSIVDRAITPVNYYTGIPNINVPIYEINQGGISVPISISYNAQGHKVTQVASEVGLGWDLNAGGVITRIMQGLPDESTEGYCGANKRGYSLEQQIANKENLHKFWNNFWDSAPDVFYYNFNGNSGRFILDKDGNPLSLPHSDIKIIPPICNDAGHTSWTIITPDGTRYTFGDNISNDFEEGTRTSFQGTSITYISSWYLKEIESVDGHKVTFQYHTLGSLNTIDYFQKSWRVKYWRETGCTYQQQYIYPGNYNLYQFERLTELINMKLIKSIHFANGRIDFELSDENRADIENGKSLERIVVQDDQGDEVTHFRFKYSYFAGNRLKLDELAQKGLPPHQFFYNTQENLPSRGAFTQVDFWGYYNGNQTKVDENGRPTDDPNGTPISIGIENRRVDREKIQANIIEKIIFPTGGSVSYLFETNGAIYNEFPIGLRIAQQVIYDINSGTSRKIHYRYVDPDDPNTSSHKSSYDYWSIVDSYIKIDEVAINWEIDWCDYPGDNGCEGIWRTCNQAFAFYVQDSETTNSHFGNFDLGSGHKTVIVEEEGNGKTIYHYRTYDEYDDEPPIRFTQDHSPLPNYWSGAPYTPSTSRFWERGLLDKVQVYNNSGNLIQEEIFQYESDLSKGKAIGLTSFNGINSVVTGSYDPITISDEYHHGTYEIESQRMIETSRTLKKYSPDWIPDGNNQNETTNYIYSNTHSNAIEITKDIGDGTQIIERYKYPNDYSDPDQTTFVGKMQEANQVGIPIESSTWVKRGTDAPTFLSARLAIFEEYPLGNRGRMLPSSTFKSASITSPSSSFISSYISSQGFTYDESKYNLQDHILDYKLGEKALLVSDETLWNHVENSLVWGYHDTYIIAEILNAKSTQVSYLNFEETFKDTEGKVYMPNNWIPIDNGGEGDPLTIFTYLKGRCQTNRDVCEHNCDCNGNNATSGQCEACLVECEVAYETCLASAIDSYNLLFAQSEQVAHTGKRSLLLHPGASLSLQNYDTGFEPETYELSCWVYGTAGSSFSINGESFALTREGWNRLTKTLNDYKNQIINLDNTSGLMVYLDDLRLYPQNARLTTYTYEPLIGITSVSDHNNIPGYFTYDELNRLETLKDEEEDIITNYEYNYGTELNAFINIPDCATKGEPINFSAVGQIETSTPPSTVWDFGDGSGLNLSSYPSHTYQEAGIYTVTLSIEHPEYPTRVAKEEIEIYEPFSSLTLSCDLGCSYDILNYVPQNIRAQVSGGNPAGNKYYWYISDSPDNWGPPSNIPTDAESIPIAQSTNSYWIRCVVTDGCNASVEQVQKITVEGEDVGY